MERLERSSGLCQDVVIVYGAQTTAENATVQDILWWWPDMNANICTVTVNASLTLYSAPVSVPIVSL